MSSAKINLLYLDDEENNLESFKASFRRYYNIFTTTSIDKAESLLSEHEIHIVLADQRMPVMTGVQFFEKIRSSHPEPIRILITGYSDINAAIDSINKGEVFRFIDKPWDHDYVKTAIENAYDIYSTRKQLKEKNIELQKAYDELDKFVYSASHDLRAPLMSILGIVQLAMMEKDVKSQNQYLMLIDSCVRKLDTFILNIIDYYKNSRTEINFVNIDFRQLVHDTYESLKYYPNTSNIDFDFKIEQSGPFISDIIKIRIVLNNLFTNAIKYQRTENPDKKVRIHVVAQAEKATITVEDNGIGIRKEQLEDIFKMFYRGTIHNTGSGIGLYIVHEAIQKLHGQIDVQSSEGNGTTFIIQIPSINTHEGQ